MRGAREGISRLFRLGIDWAVGWVGDVGGEDLLAVVIFVRTLRGRAADGLEVDPVRNVAGGTGKRAAVTTWASVGRGGGIVRTVERVGTPWLACQ